MASETDLYRTIEKPVTGLFKDKGSKFLSFAFPVSSEDNIKERINQLKKEYFDARHHCFAYALGIKREIYRVFDDGEPSGTAGKPIFGQIQSHNVTNILIVVVRYFGGTLLGTGGLIHAYKTAAADALQHATIIEKTQNRFLLLEFDYLELNSVMKILKDENVAQSDHEFDNLCKMKISVRHLAADKLISKLEKVNTLKIKEL